MSRTLADSDQFEEPPHPADDRSSQPVPVLTCMENVTARDVEWIWFQRLAVGKLTVLAGAPGLGKSWLSLYIAAQLSYGGPWPDGGSAPLMNTLLMNAEDALDDTIKPRLIALGADCSRIHALAMSRIGLREKFVQLSDISVIEKAMDETGAGLVVIDPVTAFLGDKVGNSRPAQGPPTRSARLCSIEKASASDTSARRGRMPARPPAVPAHWCMTCDGLPSEHSSAPVWYTALSSDVHRRPQDRVDLPALRHR